MTGDQELLEAWRAGDAKAGRELVERHFAAIHRFFHNKVSGGVEDLVQQTFLACIEGRDRYRGEGSFRGWLLGIAYNILRGYLRAKYGEPDLSTASAFDLGPSPSAVLVARAEEQLVLEGLRRIPLDYQIVLELHYWERLKSHEIADVLGIPAPTVRSRLRRGRLALEEQVKLLASSPADVTSTLDRLDDWAASIRAHVGVGGNP